MARSPLANYEQCSDEILMDLYFDLSRSAGENAVEIAAIESELQARLVAAYGASEIVRTGRVRYSMDSVPR